MKKLLSYYLLLLVVLCFSCKKDDEEASPVIVGEWVYVRGEYTDCDDGSDDDIDTDSNGCGDNFCIVLTFNSNKTFSYVVSDMGDTFTATGTYSQSGTKLMMECKTDDHGTLCEDIEPETTVSFVGEDLVTTGRDSYGICNVNERWEKN